MFKIVIFLSFFAFGIQQGGYIDGPNSYTTKRQCEQDIHSEVVKEMLLGGINIKLTPMGFVDIKIEHMECLPVKDNENKE